MTSDFTSEHEYLGVEFDWVAVDTVGRVGYFSTAGVGPIPSILDRTKIIDDLFEFVMDMPVISEVMQINAFEKNASDWIEAAKRGLFSFDWSRNLSMYQLIAVPENSLNIAELNIDRSDNKLDYFSKIRLGCDFEGRSGNEELLVFNSIVAENIKTRN